MPIVKVEDIASKSFDYVIIGAGTAGSALAARLSEESSVSVLVLEAGPANFDDANIDMPAQFGKTFGNPQYDWDFKTVKQPLSADREFTWNRGKAIGGTSTLNFYCWVKPPAEDIDAFERLGNPGWNWEDFAKYSRKSERFHLPAKEVMDNYPHTYDAKNRGLSGPIHVTIPHSVHTVDKIFQETLVNKGLKAVKDPYGGDITGTFTTSSNLDPSTWKRSHSGSAYIRPNLSRSNLNVLTEALVSQILFADSPKGAEVTATGVEFVVGDKTYSVKASKEVIVSAGTINSPKILELSGIGQPQVLSSIGVPVKVELPGVGENVQEHSFYGISFELDSSKVNHTTLDFLGDGEFAAKSVEEFAQGKGLFRTAITSFSYFSLGQANPNGAPAVYALAEKEVKERKAKGVPGLAEQLDIQLEYLKNEHIPDFEMVAFPALFTTLTPPKPKTAYFSVFGMLNHPISRGTIHAASKDPKVQPVIDPRYFESETDMQILLEQFKYIRSFKDVEPFKSGVLHEVDPGPNVQTDEQMKDYIRNHLTTTWHTVGSCSMLPRDKQGVVDPKLKVYGTTNVRVVDISIIPLHVASHTQTIAYMIGEKAADLVKADIKK